MLMLNVSNHISKISERRSIAVASRRPHRRRGRGLWYDECSWVAEWVMDSNSSVIATIWKTRTWMEAERILCSKMSEPWLLMDYYNDGIIEFLNVSSTNVLFRDGDPCITIKQMCCLGLMTEARTMKARMPAKIIVNEKCTKCLTRHQLKN